VRAAGTGKAEIRFTQPAGAKWTSQLVPFENSSLLLGVGVARHGGLL
jgi:hypothetical protein